MSPPLCACGHKATEHRMELPEIMPFRDGGSMFAPIGRLAGCEAGTDRGWCGCPRYEPTVSAGLWSS